MVCGECKVLVDSFEETYGGHCANYCEALGLSCVAAWEEVGDSCEEASVESCDHHMHGEDGSSISTSDAICQCEPGGVSPFSVSSGSCTTTASGDCVRSPNFPHNYGGYEDCGDTWDGSPRRKRERERGNNEGGRMASREFPL